MHKIIMPKAGQTMEEGAVLRWLKREGETVGVGEVVVEVETDKAVAEVPSEVSGVLRKILVPEGKAVPVLTPLAYVGLAEEELPGETAQPETRPAGLEPSLRASTPGSAGVTGRSSKLASPRARKLAAEHGVDLSLVSGSGAEGRITEDDVKNFLNRR